MKNLKITAAACAAFALGSLGFGQARADEVLYDNSGFLLGSQSFVESFDLSNPGTLTVTLTNVAWPQQLTSLNLLLTTTNGILGPEMSAGTQTFNVAAGDFFAQWFGTAQGPLDAGVYSMKIEFTPSSGGSPVPLPTSILLLVSGLGLLIWQRRSRTEPPQPAVAPPVASAAGNRQPRSGAEVVHGGGLHAA